MIPALLMMRGECVVKTVFLAKDDRHASEMVRSMYLGRSTNCGVALEEEHTSVADFHLLLNVDCNLRTLRITDLQTRFGTWISELKLEPNVKYVLEEDRVLQLGSSRRLYKLQWLPLHCSINQLGQFVPQLRGSVAIFGGANSQAQQQQQGMMLMMREDTKLWYVVADISCLLDPPSRGLLGHLRQPALHTQVWLPAHVVTQLGRLEMEYNQMASDALEWIRKMLAEGGSWIHLQAPGQRLSIHPNPSSSALECGFFVRNSIAHGGVVVVTVTEDVALKAVSQSIGLECDKVDDFVRSLYDPHSRRCLHPIPPQF